ncbi:MAG: DUF1848 domain-containing protein [Oscillospiraceae bacterium]|jgi:hypothetical protein|nr:DUF1848 domain-containing protein [Oscillospiraceae bacterium]
MIISASRRTDIPCFFAGWFQNRLDEGYAITRNPFNPSQLSRVSLRRGDVDCFVFWTKDPQPFLPVLKTLDARGDCYYFQFTLTPYGNDIERRLRPKAAIEETFIKLSETIGKERVLWRYDPVIVNPAVPPEYHKEQFERLCERLRKHTGRVTLSFVDAYAKIKSPAVRPVAGDVVLDLAACFGKTAHAYGITPVSCCEPYDLSAFGISHGACIDSALIERLTGRPLTAKADRNQRNGCSCCAGTDIGAYNTCQNGCVYCYASHSAASVQNNLNQHDDHSPLFIGMLKEGDKVKEK